jgi:acyl-coenzyme A synthetase/AMP-(fatty) acid ligase
VVLDVKDEGKLKGKGGKKLESAVPDDIALVLHTSGTTGRPKAVSRLTFEIDIELLKLYRSHYRTEISQER